MYIIISSYSNCTGTYNEVWNIMKLELLLRY